MVGLGGDAFQAEGARRATALRQPCDWNGSHTTVSGTEWGALTARMEKKGSQAARGLAGVRALAFTPSEMRSHLRV